MRLVLQRGSGDCSLAALATWTEQTYEDVFVEAAKVDQRNRGKNGLYTTTIQRIARGLGVDLVTKRKNIAWDVDEGLLIVEWTRGSRQPVGDQHVLALAHGVVADPSDGLILSPEEYFAREFAKPIVLLMERE